MQIGEFLVQNKEYATASWQCYDRYLNDIATFNIEQIRNIDDLKSTFFADGIENQNSDVTARALMGHCICMFHFSLLQDPRLQSSYSIQQIIEILRFLRLIMQFLLETERFCWLVYNATTYLYTICRFMMQYGQSKIVIKFFFIR